MRMVGGSSTNFADIGVIETRMVIVTTRLLVNFISRLRSCVSNWSRTKQIEISEFFHSQSRLWDTRELQVTRRRSSLFARKGKEAAREIQPHDRWVRNSQLLVIGWPLVERWKRIMISTEDRTLRYWAFNSEHVHSWKCFHIPGGFGCAHSDFDDFRMLLHSSAMYLVKALTLKFLAYCAQLFLFSTWCNPNPAKEAFLPHPHFSCRVYSSILSSSASFRLGFRHVSRIDTGPLTVVLFYLADPSPITTPSSAISGVCNKEIWLHSLAHYHWVNLPCHGKIRGTSRWFASRMSRP